MIKPSRSQVVICPIHKTYFSGHVWQGLDYRKIKENLADALPNYDIKISSLNAIVSDPSLLSEKCSLFLSSSYDKSYQKYICDVARHIAFVRPDVRLIPSYDMLLAHENKGYQELIKKRLGISELRGEYYGDISDFESNTKTDFPYVVKLLEGAMSSNVFLASDYQDLRTKLKKKGNKNLRYELKQFLRSYIIKHKYNNISDEFSIQNYGEFFRTRTPFIIQDYVSALTHDYKVLVFGDKYFTLKRYVKENDFRASGSGNFTYEAPPLALLEYAKKIADLLDSPFVSLDIAEREGNCYLIEFQGIGFGPVTLVNSSGYYANSVSGEGGSWNFIEEEPDLEQSYADALKSFINNKLANSSETINAL